MHNNGEGVAEACPFCFMPIKNQKTHQECLWGFTPFTLVKTTYNIVNLEGIELLVPVNYHVEPIRQWLVN